MRNTEYDASRRLARLLDESITLPGGFRIGLDGLLGLIPGFGDVLGGLISITIVYRAYRRGLPASVLLRMLVNIMIDTGFGAIPLLGDIFDLVWKSNQRNIRLMDDYRHTPEKTRQRSVAANVLFLAALVAVIILLGWLLLGLFAMVWDSIHAYR